MERPFSDITTSGLGTNVQDVPDFATHLRYETDLGHLQASALLRSIGYRPTDEEVTRLTGVGVSGSAVFHPWAILMGTDPVREENPSGLTRSRILLQYTWGPGTARYVNDLVGQGLDGQVNPITGDFNLVNSNGMERQLRELVQCPLANELHLFRGPRRQQRRSAWHYLRHGQIPGRQPVVDSDPTYVVWNRVHVGPARESGRRGCKGPADLTGFSSTTSDPSPATRLLTATRVA